MLFLIKVRMLLLLVFSATILVGCGGGGGGGSTPTINSSTVVQDEDVEACPYGVEESVMTTVVDGKWRTRTTVNYLYSDRTQIVEVETIIEEDSDADGIADSRQVTVDEYEQLASIPADALWSPFIESVNIGSISIDYSSVTLIHSTIDDFLVNDEGAPSAYPHERREYTYNYTASGLQLLNRDDRWRYDSTTGSVLYHSVESVRHQYNAQGDVTLYATLNARDDNGDGVNESERSVLIAYTFDSAGNLTHIRDETSDSGLTIRETFCNHTYEAGFLVASEVTLPSEPSYSISYLYNDSGLLRSKVFSFDLADITPDVDKTITLTYEYDAENRITHVVQLTRTDNNEDGLVDVTKTVDTTWGYDSEGLVVSQYQETTVDEAASEGLQEHSAYSWDSTYTNGRLTQNRNRYLIDEDLDGELEWSEEEVNRGYFYDNGYLTHIDDRSSLSFMLPFEIGGDADPVEARHTVDFNYENNVLVSFTSKNVTVPLSDPDPGPYADYDYGIVIDDPDVVYAATFSYDASDQLITMTTNLDDDGDEIVDESETFTFDYATSGFVDVNSQFVMNGVEQSTTEFSFDFGDHKLPAGMNEETVNHFLYLPFESYPEVGAFYAQDWQTERNIMNLPILLPKMMCLIDGEETATRKPRYGAPIAVNDGSLADSNLVYMDAVD